MAKQTPRYPEITVELVGQDGTAIITAVVVALYEAGVDNAEVQVFRREAAVGDHGRLLRTCMAWVNVATRPAR